MCLRLTKIKTLRIATPVLAVLVVASGAIGELYYGGICTLGIGQFWATCPLGFLERSLAVRSLLPQWPSAALVVVLVILLGRVFCGWICPPGLLRRLLPAWAVSKAKRGSETGRAGSASGAGGTILRSTHGNETAAAGREAAEPAGLRWESYSAYAILGGTLVASYVLQFPVFCFFCPIGLFFGALYSVMRFVSADPFGLELVLFPVMLGIELWLLHKHWCRSICPIGALLSILGSLNRFLLPTFIQDKCLTSKGAACGACRRVCPEGIDLPSIGHGLAANSCTKCLECYERCPKGAIEIAIVR